MTKVAGRRRLDDGRSTHRGARTSSTPHPHAHTPATSGTGRVPLVQLAAQDWAQSGPRLPALAWAGGDRRVLLARQLACRHDIASIAAPNDPGGRLCYSSTSSLGEPVRLSISAGRAGRGVPVGPPLAGRGVRVSPHQSRFADTVRWPLLDARHRLRTATTTLTSSAKGTRPGD